MTDDERLDQIRLATEAIERIAELRERLSFGDIGVNPVQDSTLAKAEYHVRGVRDELVGRLGVDEVGAVLEEFDDD